ncbi:hypothetical protein EBS67_00520 [bacterium]|nr:hypothetical protein [bacterium]NBT60754.1 hypothetical protein [Planctomycetia bacterium]
MRPDDTMTNLTDDLRHITEGFPAHPILENYPVLWDEEGDEWIFRRTTNVLVPKLVDVVDIKEPDVRYTVAAIRRSVQNGGGIDFVIWLEADVPDEKTGIKKKVSQLCFGPSHAENMNLVNSTISTTMMAFEQVYKDPKWISQFEKRIIV